MFQSLIARAASQAVSGFSVNSGAQYSRVSTNTTADATAQYVGHVDIPAGKLTGLMTDWHAHIKVLYESGTIAAAGDTASAPTATTNLKRRFHIRVSPITSLDPTDINNSIGMSDPAESTASRGGQLSCEIAAVAGSFGCEIRASSSWDAQSDFLRHAQPLTRWYDQYASQGLRISVFFNWETPFAADVLMKVSSISVRLTPGAPISLVTTPRTLTLDQFGLHWNRWPKLATAVNAPAENGELFGTVRSWDCDISNAGSGISWHAIETSNWDTLTNAQRQADPGWAGIDNFVAKHANKRRIITVGYMSRFHTTNGSLNMPPSDLANGVTGSWYTFCTQLGTRFTGKGNHYEIFNEPYPITSVPFTHFGVPAGCSGWGGTVAQMSTMIVQAAAALRAADPTCKIIGPGFLNVVDRGAGVGQGYTYAKSILSDNGNAALNAVDYLAVHGYPISIDGGKPSPTAALGFLRNVRRMATELGAPTKPIFMTEVSTDKPFYRSLPVAERIPYLQRTVATVLLGDPFVQAIGWYGIDYTQTILGWTADDTAAWNSLATFLTSGPVTAAIINQDGTVSVTIGSETRIY